MILIMEHAGLLAMVFQNRCFKFSIWIISLILAPTIAHWNDSLQREAFEFTAGLAPVFQPIRELISKFLTVIPLYNIGTDNLLLLW